MTNIKKSTKRLAIVFLSIIMVLSVFSVGFKAKGAELGECDNANLNASTYTITFKNTSSCLTRFMVAYSLCDDRCCYVSSGELDTQQSADVDIPRNAKNIVIFSGYYLSGRRHWSHLDKKVYKDLSKDLVITYGGTLLDLWVMYS